MKRAALLFAVVAVVARASASGPALPPDWQNVLTTIDAAPTVSQLDGFFGSGSAGPSLVSIVTNDANDVGIRLRAIHALVHYPGAASETAVKDLITAHATDTSGAGALTLRAALETLGQLRNPDDYANITPSLEHSSRDIRAAAAFALRDLGDPRAVCALRARLQHEATQQVKLAISAALRVLGESTCQ